MKKVCCLFAVRVYPSMRKIARLGHQFCIMKHDVDEIKISPRQRQFIFNKLWRDFSTLCSPPRFGVLFFMAADDLRRELLARIKVRKTRKGVVVMM